MLYSFSGKVIHGLGLGHQHHMPTANLEVKNQNIKHGVYASVITVKGQKYYGVTNIGPRPSVDDDKTVKAETYILDFNENIYDEIIQLDLVYYLRGIHKFKDIDEVVKQVNQDIADAKERLSSTIKL